MNKFYSKINCKISFSITNNSNGIYSFGLCNNNNENKVLLEVKNNLNFITINSFDIRSQNKQKKIFNIKKDLTNNRTYTLEIHDKTCFLYYEDSDNEISYVVLENKYTSFNNCKFFVKGENITLNNIDYYLTDKNGVNIKEHGLKSNRSWGGNRFLNEKWDENDFISQYGNDLKIENNIVTLNCSKGNYVIFNNTIHDNTIIELTLKSTSINGTGLC